MAFDLGLNADGEVLAAGCPNSLSHEASVYSVAQERADTQPRMREESRVWKTTAPSVGAGSGIYRVSLIQVPVTACLALVLLRNSW